MHHCLARNRCFLTQYYIKKYLKHGFIISLFAYTTFAYTAAHSEINKEKIASDAVTYLTHAAPHSTGQSRLHYEAELLHLMLEKTRVTHGNYMMSSIPDTSTTSRNIRRLKSNRQDNFVRGFSVNKKLLEDPDLIFIDFPIMRGSSSYRICFSSEKNRDKLSNITNFKNLVTLTHVQGIGWPDKKVLRHAGFLVYDAGTQNAIFEMAARGRADLLCRGLGEYKGDWDFYKDKMPRLIIDTNFVIFYPFPRYFFAHKSDRKLLKRLSMGLNIAYADGSFIALWKRYHIEAIKFAELHKRRIFTLKNPALNGVKLRYAHYFQPATPELQNSLIPAIQDVVKPP